MLVILDLGWVFVESGIVEMEKYLSGNTRRMYRQPISRTVLFRRLRQVQVVDFT